MSKDRLTESTHDQWMSDRHRVWGNDCPMLDIDTVWIEYDSHKAVLLVEYKKANGKAELANVAALVDLADRAGIPALGVRYHPNSLPWQAEFEVTALAKAGRDIFDGRRIWMSEIEYVELLYRYRRRQVPAHIRRDAAATAELRRPFTQEALTT